MPNCSYFSFLMQNPIVSILAMPFCWKFAFGLGLGSLLSKLNCGGLKGLRGFPSLPQCSAGRKPNKLEMLLKGGCNILCRPFQSHYLKGPYLYSSLTKPYFTVRHNLKCLS